MATMNQNMFAYVCSNAPNEAITAVENVSNLRPKNVKEAYDAMIEIFKRGSYRQKEALLLEIREIHPDNELLLSIDEQPAVKEILIKKSTPISETKNNASGCGCGNCNTYKAYGSNTVVDPKTSSLEMQLVALKSESATGRMLKDQAFRIIVAIVAIVILYKIFIKDGK